MEYGPPPLFNQGVSARARLAFFSFLAITLIIVDSRIRVLETIRLGLGIALYPVQQALLVPSRAAFAVGDYVTSVGALTRENEQLKRERAESARMLLQVGQLAAENRQLRSLLGAHERVGAQTVLGQVLYEPRDRFSRKLVIDRGSTESVSAGAPVIDAAGVVGQVTRVFPRSAEVTLLTDKDQSIPVQILRNGLRGVAFGGSEPGTLDLRFMPGNADVVNDDLAVTSGLDGVYPPGLPVGRVARVERSVKDQFARIVMTPAAGVENNTHLLVLIVDAAKIAPPPPPQPAAAPERRPARR
jgi:rod shape-determining protein MreC